MRVLVGRLLYLFIWLVATVVPALTWASSYALPQFSLPNLAGQLSSEHYNLNATSLPLLGVSAATTYHLDVGFPSVTGGTISLTVDNTTVNLGRLTPGTPISASTVTTVTTNASAGYSLAVSKNQILTHTDGLTTIGDFAGTIASPTPWSGTGLGLTVATGTTLESKWGSGSNFAAIPTQTATTVHTVSHATSSADQTTFTYKLDTVSSQKTGSYTALVAYTATVLP